ncbi:MAG: hypothetical protein H6Q05_4101 [Acidobacteria bacterium]|nr:hypothetical protein [Acidobacteriota bacterium]
MDRAPRFIRAFAYSVDLKAWPLEAGLLSGQLHKYVAVITKCGTKDLFPKFRA